MKVGGVSTEKENALFGPLTFKRGKQFLAFYAQPVWDMDEFDELLPAPKNEKMRFSRENGKEPDPKNPVWREAMARYSLQRWGYVVLKSLEPSNIEWEGVSIEDPETWDKVEEVLQEHLGVYEFSKVMSLVDEANGIDQAKLEANQQTFFQLEAAKAEQSQCQKGGAENSSSPALASDSE